MRCPRADIKSARRCRKFWAMADGDISLEPLFVDCLTGLYDQLVQMDERIKRLDQRIERIASADEQAKLLMTIPGIGPMTATALLFTAGTSTPGPC